MGKYNFELDLIKESALLMILQQIQRASTVLEFGPANGRLTRYLNQKLDCRMYLVEIDREAGQEALQYAEDLVVGDAEEYEWYEQYRHIKFDCIVFADVLEHLRDPLHVLAAAKQLMKENGSIFISVPNLAHNAVIINLLKNKFEYSPVGLLDNTHIHFFTKNSLEKMISDAGLYPVKKFATYKRSDDCEIPASVDEIKGISAEFWNNRLYGEVYQYVYEVKKNAAYSDMTEDYLLPNISKTYLQIFMDDGAGWSEDLSIKMKLQDYNGINSFDIVFPREQKKVRLDPMNCCGIVIIKQITAKYKGLDIDIDVAANNARMTVGKYYFYTQEDPQIFIESKDFRSFDFLKVEIEYSFLGDIQTISKVMDILKEYEKNDSQKELLKSSIRSLEKQQDSFNTLIAEKDKCIEKFQELETNKDERIEFLKKELMEKDKMIDLIHSSRIWKLMRMIDKLRGKR